MFISVWRFGQSPKEIQQIYTLIYNPVSALHRRQSPRLAAVLKENTRIYRLLSYTLFDVPENMGKKTEYCYLSTYIMPSVEPPLWRHVQIGGINPETYLDTSVYLFYII